jgi:hypothetical protein
MPKGSASQELFRHLAVRPGLADLSIRHCMGPLTCILLYCGSRDSQGRVRHLVERPGAGDFERC